MRGKGGVTCIIIKTFIKDEEAMQLLNHVFIKRVYTDSELRNAFDQIKVCFIFLIVYKPWLI